MNETQSMNYNFLFKYIIIGDASVGKSCILNQLINEDFNFKYNVTVGVEFGSKLISVDENMIKLQIWDTAGQEAFRSITRSYFRSAAGAILVYDITNKESFKHLQNWLKEISENCSPNVTTLLVGNKSDLDKQRQVSYQEGKNFAQENNLRFFESSAKLGTNVQKVFHQSAEDIYSKFMKNQIDVNSEFSGVRIGSRIKLSEFKESSSQQVKKRDKIKMKCCN